MAVNSKHPLYAEHVPDWRQMRHTYRGQREVKLQGLEYLPATSGMTSDGLQTANSPGYRAYLAYRTRATFPGLVKEAVEAMLGVMHHKPPVITLPAKMEPMRERATITNESLEMLLRRINEEQLIAGRLGLLLEVPTTPGSALPFVAMYHAERILNWDVGPRDLSQMDSLNVVAIDETETERQDDFEWEVIEKTRLLLLGDPDVNEVQGVGVYRAGVFREDQEFADEQMVTPMIGGTTIDRIPFVFINTKDVVPTPDDPPLLDLSNTSLTIYRGSADYRQALFMQGQDTLVTIGSTSETDVERRMGAGAEVALPQGGDAKFIGVSSTGLPEMRESIENDFRRGEALAKGLLEAVSSAAESGEALRIRVAARTANLNQIALAGAFGLQELLRMAAVWVGANPEEVLVEPNLDFVADIMTGRELTDIMSAKMLGAPISLQSVHELMQERGITQSTWEEELELIDAEVEAGLVGAAPPEEPDPNADPNGDFSEDEDAPPEGDAGRGPKKVPGKKAAKKATKKPAK